MKKVHLGLFFKDFAMWLHSSCVGLNVAGHATAKVLRERGIDVEVFAVRHNVDIVEAIDKYNQTHRERMTHAVISAPWLSVSDVKALLENFQDVEFVILSHSNVGFLQADPDGVYLLRQYAKLSDTLKNLHVGGNSQKFAEWFEEVYDHEVVLLPNLYPLQKSRSLKQYKQGVVKIGAFGAVRPYKNFMTAAAAALLIQRELNVPVEFHMSSGGEGDGFQTIPAIQQIFADTKVMLVLHDWQFWDDFIQLVAKMDLLIQVSYTESFNMVTADGISQGVPTVTSPAIYWVPQSWKAEPDNVLQVAEVGLRLLRNKPNSDGLQALDRHNQKSLNYWLGFLGLQSWHRSITKWLGF